LQRVKVPITPQNVSLRYFVKYMYSKFALFAVTDHDNSRWSYAQAGFVKIICPERIESSGLEKIQTAVKTIFRYFEPGASGIKW